MRQQPIKKVRIDTWTSEFNSFIHRSTIGSIEDNYCPQDAIDKFWSKYIVFGCQDLLFQMHIAASFGIERAGGWVDDPRKLDEFYNDLYEVFLSLYLEHRYNLNKEKVIFVKEGEDEIV